MHNQTRMQKKPYCREERFLSIEKPLLKALPDESFEIKYYRDLKVAQNNHVYLTKDKHYYRVPYQHIGQKVKVIYTRALVRLYLNGEMIALHPRNYTAGGYTTTLDHLCSHYQHYLNRRPAYYMERVANVSQNLLAII